MIWMWMYVVLALTSTLASLSGDDVSRQLSLFRAIVWGLLAVVFAIKDSQP